MGFEDEIDNENQRFSLSINSSSSNPIFMVKYHQIQDLMDFMGKYPSNPIFLAKYLFFAENLGFSVNLL